MSNSYIKTKAVVAWLTLVTIFVMPISILAQTKIVAPKNKYNIQDDVKLGREAAQQVQQQMPLLRDGNIDNYIESVGQRLAAAIPAEFQHREFTYTFDVVNARDINAFALPGGPMFLNRGMIEAAHSEGEMAGVMAHEMSHVALRHATAQATETQKFQIGSILGQIAGAVIGGVPGAIIGTGSQIGFGAGALKYSRKYETQADILGAQTMARAGYDPRDLAKMFQTIQAQGGSGGPEWLSSHPNPGNRYERINQEAAMLRINPNNAVRDSRRFQQVQAQLRSLPRAPSMEEIARSGQRNPNGNTSGYPTSGNDRPTSERVAYPSSRYRNVGNNLFTASTPDNWQEIGDNSSIWYAPEGGYGQYNGQSVFTHGVNFGVAQTQSANLSQATSQFINSLAQSNGNLRMTGGPQRTSISGRNALVTTLTNTNEATGRPENIRVITTQLRNGQLFFMIAVAPQGERNFENAFQRIFSSVRIND